MPGGYVVRDANGEALVYVYSENEAEAMQATAGVGWKPLGGISRQIGWPSAQTIRSSCTPMRGPNDGTG